MKKQIKITNKLKEELVVFNQTVRKRQKERPLTMDEFVKYLHGKGLPDMKKTNTVKAKSPSIPGWAVNPFDYPSGDRTNYVPTKNSIMDRLHTESEEIRTEILKKKARIAIPYSKGAYQYINDETMVTTLGRKV